MNGPRKLLLAVMFVILAATFSAASDIYIAQNATGGNTGADCADAHAASWFNSSSNWGSGSGKIGPGTTVHLCGTFTAPAGSSGYLTFQGSGSSGNPITLLFESGAVLTAPYWGGNGAIQASGGSNIIIDGGNNGAIQATANGSPSAGYANHQDGAAVYFSRVSGGEIKNLTIANIYVHTDPTDESGQNTYGVDWVDGNGITIDNNTVHDGGKWCIYSAYHAAGSTSDINIFSNTVYHCDHGIVIGDGDPGSTLQGTNTIHDNVIYDPSNWDDNANNNHHDGIHLWAVNGGGSVGNNVSLYNNDIHGSWGSHMNSLIYIEGNWVNTGAFNNLLVVNSGCASGAGLLAIAGQGMGGSNEYLYNNTVVGDSTQFCSLISVQGGVQNVVVKNNIATTGSAAFYSTNDITISLDHNLYYNWGGSGWTIGGKIYSTLSSYQSGSGQDVHGAANNPNLGSGYMPPAGSPAVGLGGNLTTLGMTPLDSDKADVARGPNGNCTQGVPRMLGCGSVPVQHRAQPAHAPNRADRAG